MSPNLVFRTTAALAGIAMGLAGPSSGLAHAHHHDHDAHSYAHHGLYVWPHDLDENPASGGSSDHEVTPTSPADHEHPLLQAGVAVRGGAVAPAIPTTAPLASIDRDPLVTLSDDRSGPLLLVATATGPPPPSRAPPTF